MSITSYPAELVESVLVPLSTVADLLKHVFLGFCVAAVPDLLVHGERAIVPAVEPELAIFLVGGDKLSWRRLP